MDALKRTLVGWIIVAAGIVIAIVGGLADQIGLGGSGPDSFGGKQVAALIIGLVIAAAGLAVVLWSPRSKEPPAAASPDPST